MEQRRLSLNRETTSLPDELDGFYGRDGDKEAIIRSLLLSDDANAGNLGVIPIFGMGGIGKTTLAQHVYNDEEVAKQFNIRGWICVSVEFTVLRLTKLILEEVTGTASDSNNLNQLHRNLKDALDGKKFLLVLDDVWSEDYNEWTKLLTPLRSGAKGSKIIITTRSKEVASKVQTVPTHDLRVLEYEDCWKLFARHACLDVNSTTDPLDLQDIGKKIVRKCGGLPLAAKTLGGVLRWQTKVEKWEKVLKSEIWDVRNANILPALAMSYIHLPSHLKRCFAYCAMFPQDYLFKKEKLVALWMSEGFLVQLKGNQSLEEIGDMCFDDLVARSFFQHSSNTKGDLFFVMHDLVHDLARFVSGEFCSRLDGWTSWKIGKRTRHVSYRRKEEDDLMKFQSIHETPFLRSFIHAQQTLVCCLHRNRHTSCFEKKVINRHTCCIENDRIREFPTRKLLRVLSLCCDKIRELPNSIGNLKHMRHLDLSRTSIRLLPEAVTDLFNLEILILRECRYLVELPVDMSRLINLCQLDLKGTNLQRMPPEMGKLKKLSKLSDFIVGENGGSSIEELGHLHCLRGQIFIRGLQNVKDVWDASEAILKDKENLKVLDFSWKDYADYSRRFLNWKGYANYSRQAEEVLERLQPHIHIKCIEIVCYGGTKFPNWVGDVSFSKLKKMLLRGCKNCICLPPLGQLASLEELSIDGDGDAVLAAIGLEFYGVCKPGEKAFSSLRRLKFIGMKNWQVWSSFNGAFPVLEELELSECPKLMSVPINLPSLKRLWISSCGELNFENLLISTCATLEAIYIRRNRGVKCMSVETFSNLKVLEIRDCYNLDSLGSTAATTATRKSDPLYFPSLTKLHISGCSKLVSFPRELHAPNLKHLEIYNCLNLKSLPQSTHSLLSSLEKLELHNCPKLLFVPTHLPSLKRLWITSCGELDLENLLISTCSTLETIHIEGSEKVKCISVESFPNLNLLEMINCSDLESLVVSTATTTTTSDPLFSPSLTSLSIRGCSKLVSFPRGGLHAPNLKRMVLSGCWNLKSLPQDMHSLLPSLEYLSISDCPEIESFPEGGLPSKLQSFLIECCEKLVESSFPEETLLPSSLQSLKISGLAKMKSLNSKGLRHLSSLQHLQIFHCENLESLPEEGLPSSLSRLDISGCPLLKKRCERKIGPRLSTSPIYSFDECVAIYECKN